ncbi:hypothetical protein DINM_020500 [Dirofilaria immitis]|nr:hypothetical protein [Dirofilaria immitis]
MLCIPTDFRERIQNDLATIERLNKHARQIEQQNSIRINKKLSEKEDEIGKVYVQLSDEADTFEKRIMQKMQNGERLMEQEKIQEFLPNGSSFMLSIPNHALQIELADALAKYEKSMRQISTLEGKISSMEAESQYVDSLRHELQALRLRYENLLEAHGEKIERIEELELDLADLKKLLKDQIAVAASLCISYALFTTFALLCCVMCTNRTIEKSLPTPPIWREIPINIPTCNSKNLRKIRIRERTEEENDGFIHERIKAQHISVSTNEAAMESGDIGRRTKRKSFPNVHEDLRNQRGIGETCREHEQPVRSSKRLKKSDFDSPRQSDEVSKVRIMLQGKVGHNYEDDAIDVVTSNDDPLTEIDVESLCFKSSSKSISPTRRDIFVDSDIRYGYDGPSGSGVLRLDRKPVPATAPLLTTERTHVRVAKRKHDEAAKQRERRLQERELLSRDGRGRNTRTNRYYYDEKSMLDDVDDVMYAEIGLGDSDFIETSFEDEELIYAADDLVTGGAEESGNCDSDVGGERMPSQSIQETHSEGKLDLWLVPLTGLKQNNFTGVKGHTLPKQDHIIEQVNDDVESNDDEAPPELEPQSPALQKIVQRSNANKHDETTNFTDDMNDMQVICVQTPNGTEQFIQLAPGQTLDDDNALFMSENDNVEASSRHDLRTVEFSFLDSKNICCGLCGEIVLYDLLLSSHIPQHHPEVLEEGVTAFEDVPYETWLREKLSEEKRRMENSVCNIYEDLPSSHNSSRIYRSVSTHYCVMCLLFLDSRQPKRNVTQSVNNSIAEENVRETGSRFVLRVFGSHDEQISVRMHAKQKVPVTLVDKQHARCGICNAVVSLNRKFEVVHLVRHFNAWHPSIHQCAGKWKLKKAQPGFGKPLSVQDFAVIDTSLDRGANLQCIWCGMFMAAEALAMHFSEVHPEEVEVPKCNLCLQELVINARLLEKYGEEFDVSLPDEHRIRCGKYGTTHTSEARLHAAVEKRLKPCEEGKNTNDVEDDEMEEERATSYVNSRMTFGRRSKPKRQFIMPALRQAAPVNSRYVEAVNDCHWKCKICNGDILAAVISAGAIRHFRTEHPHHLHNMQYELCKTRLERISDGCMEFINPQLIECLVCNMTYMLHRPFNMCRAIRHLRSKHPDLMPEFASTSDSGNNLQRKRLVGDQEHSEGIITDPATIATLKAQYGVDFKKVQALKGANGEPVYVLLDEGDEIDPETANQLAASVATGDFDRAKPEMRRAKSLTGDAAGTTTTTVDTYNKNASTARSTSEKIGREQQPKQQIKFGPEKNAESSNFGTKLINKKPDEATEPFIIASD